LQSWPTEVSSPKFAEDGYSRSGTAHLDLQTRRAKFKPGKEGRQTALHSFIQPHEYTLRRAIKAWCLRFIGREKLFKISFYWDELPRGRVGEVLRQLVKEIGGPRQPEGRFLIATEVSSWCDIDEERRPGVGPRSRTVIMVQGKTTFVSRVAEILREEKNRRRKPGKRRTGLVSIRKDMWER